MKTAYIFHDAFCDPTSDWYPWMKTTLESIGYLMIVPSFPTPAGQSYESWKSSIRNYIATFDSETIFIGHGIGGLFAIRILEELNVSIKGLVLVASYAEPLEHAGYNNVNKTFYKESIDWKNIIEKILFSHVYAGQDDPFVPEGISNHLAESLATPLQVIPEGGHLNKASGFLQLVTVAQDIKQSTQTLQKGIEVVPSTVTESLPQAPGPVTPLPEPVAPPSEATPTVSPESHPGIHTMYQDMSTLVNSNKGSVASSLLTKAHNEETIKKITSPTSPRNIAYMIGTLVSIIGIIIAGYFLAQKYIPALQNPSAPEVNSIIPAEKHTLITSSADEAYLLNQKIRQVLAEEISPETIHDIYYQENKSSSSFDQVIKQLGITTFPELLSSEMNQPLFMHGTGIFNEQRGMFLLLPVKNYDQSFIGMREWEPVMMRDVGVFMGMSQDTIRNKSTRDLFQDVIIQNRAMRQSVDGLGNTLYYFFISEKLVVITNSIDIIPDILKRYANRQIY